MSNTTLEENAHIQKVLLDAALNSTLIGFLLLGIYTVIYAGTVYLCYNRKSAPGLIVLSTITLLYLVNVIQNGLHWFVLKTLLAPNSGEPEPFDYALVLADSGWVDLANNICNFVLTTLADGLLIWRCYRVWGSSFRVIFLPLGLLFLEIVFYLLTIIIDCRHEYLRTFDHIEQIVSGIFSAALFTAFLTTLLTTLLIVYRIHSASRGQNGQSPLSSRPFQKVISLIVQSSAMYCIAILLAAILQVIPRNPKNEWTLFCLESYLGCVFCLFAGAAPTIMVARVALANSIATSRVNANNAGSDLDFQTNLDYSSELSSSYSSWSELDDFRAQEKIICN